MGMLPYPWFFLKNVCQCIRSKAFLLLCLYFLDTIYKLPAGLPASVL